MNERITIRLTAEMKAAAGTSLDLIYDTLWAAPGARQALAEKGGGRLRPQWLVCTTHRLGRRRGSGWQAPRLGRPDGFRYSRAMGSDDGTRTAATCLPCGGSVWNVVWSRAGGPGAAEPGNIAHQPREQRRRQWGAL